MAPACAALTVGVVLSLCLHVSGQSLPCPGRVNFIADIFHHVLHWEPGTKPSGDPLYEVQYMVYGKRPWMAVPGCTGISELSCDLTNQTMEPSNRYIARVRAMSANRTSAWSRTNAFTPTEATLHLSGVTLLVEGNTIHVKLQHPHLTVGNKVVSYEDIQKFGRRYRTYVRRATDTRQQVQEESSEEFAIPMLRWGERYCISVEPYILSRPVPSVRTQESCVMIPEEDRRTGLIAVSTGISLLASLGALLLGVLLLCAYMKKPGRTPAILKSLLKPSDLEHEPFPPGARAVVVSLDEEPIQHLCVCQDSEPPSCPESSASGTKPPPAWGCVLLTSLDGHGCLPELEGHAGGDSSCNSSDSGICLQDSSSGLSHFSESQDYRRQQPGADDSAVSLGEQPLGRACCPTSRDYSSMEEGQAQREAQHTKAPVAPAGSGEAEVEFHGYLKQPKGTAERQEARAGGGLPTPGPGEPDLSLEPGCPEPAVAKGYLKQASPGPSCGSADTALAREPGLSSASLLHYGALGITGPSKALPEAVSAWGLFSTDLLGSLPLISSLHSGERLHLDMQPRSWLGPGCKDSRL